MPRVSVNAMRWEDPPRNLRVAMQCDEMRCDEMRCDEMRCDAMGCDAKRWEGNPSGRKGWMGQIGHGEGEGRDTRARGRVQPTPQAYHAKRYNPFGPRETESEIRRGNTLNVNLFN